MQSPRLILAAATLTSLLSACSLWSERGSWHVPNVIYRPSIQQGNALSQETIDQLQPGMTKRQVNYLMGTPLIQDVFQKDRWDYVYTNAPSDADYDQQRLTLLFDDDHLVGVEGDFRPSGESKFPVAHDSVLNVPPRDLDDSWWGVMKRWFAKR